MFQRTSKGNGQKETSETFRKIRYKDNMWRVYKHRGTDKDYDAYKEALPGVQLVK